ncbi:MAG: AIM24 family protein [Suipraeoptans sp.]
MQYRLAEGMAFPIAELTLGAGEEVRIERGGMIYHFGEIKLEGKMNSNGASGLGGALKAIGRSVVSGESMFITTCTGLAPNAK